MTMTSPLRGPKSPEGGGFAADIRQRVEEQIA